MLTFKLRSTKINDILNPDSLLLNFSPSQVKWKMDLKILNVVTSHQYTEFLQLSQCLLKTSRKY